MKAYDDRLLVMVTVAICTLIAWWHRDGVRSMHYERAEEVCREHGGVNILSVRFFAAGSISVLCVDGVEIEADVKSTTEAEK